MKHHGSRGFWRVYASLPEDVRRLADEKFELLKADRHHPSLHFKRIGSVWSVRIGRHYRALGHEVPDGVQWFWIGTHSDYDKLVRG